MFEDANVRDLLAQVIEAPSPMAIEAAIRSLVHLGMFREETTDVGATEGLTPVGRAVCDLSTRPALGKAMILGHFFGYANEIVSLGQVCLCSGLLRSRSHLRHASCRCHKCVVVSLGE